MDNLNKTISFVLGLVVVLVFFAVISGRLNLKGNLPFIGKSATPTPTQTPTKIIGSSQNSQNNQNSRENNSYKNNTIKTPSTIPQTGSPTLLIPLLISGLGSGILLRRAKSK